jgi:hypothetical protein
MIIALELLNTGDVLKYPAELFGLYKCAEKIFVCGSGYSSNDLEF